VIYNLEHNFLFVHIPRTGGMSISHALFDLLPNSYLNLMEWRHRYGINIQYMLPHFSTMYKFCVVRNPWELIESDYNLTLMDIHVPTFDKRMTATDGWLQRLKRVSKYSGFVEFVAKEYLGSLSSVLEGGFYTTWCCDKDGDDLGVEPILFQELEQKWPYVCETIGISCVLMHENAVPRHQCLWTPKARDAIADLCQKDLERFNFKFQGTMDS
jgi:hypothetical protein